MSRERIVQIAQQILDGRIGIVEGCMAISRERVDLEKSQLQADVLLPFVAFESEMHNFPLGESREYWNKQALAARDARLQEIVDAARLEILDACRDLLDEWS